MLGIKNTSITTILPIEKVLKLLASKWRLQIIFLAANGATIRFSSLLRQLDGANKQSIAIALKELEKNSLLQRNIIAYKPLHVEYELTAKGQEIIPMLQKLERFVA